MFDDLNPFDNLDFDFLDFGVEQMDMDKLDGYRKLDQDNKWFDSDEKTTIEFFDYLITKDKPDLLLAYNMNERYNIFTGYRNSFIKETRYIKLYNFVRKHKDIENYFDDNGPNERFVDYLIWDANEWSFNERRLHIFRRYFDLLNESKKSFFNVYHSLSMNSNKVLENFLTNHRDLENYFDKNGPKPAFYKLLYDDKQFELIDELKELYDVKIDNEKKFFSIIFSHFKQFNGVGEWLYKEFSNKPNDEIWFDENGPTIKFMEHAKSKLTYKDYFVIMLGLSNQFLTNKNNIFTEEEIIFFNIYIKLNDDFKKIFFYNIVRNMANSSELSKWINQDGPTRQMIDLLKKMYDSQMISKDSYLEILGTLGENSLNLDIYTSPEKGFIKVYRNLSSDEKSKFILLCPCQQLNNITSNDILNHYFYEDGPTKSCLQYLYREIYTEPLVRKIVFTYDSDWKTNFTSTQLKCIELVDKYAGLSICAKRAASKIEDIPDVIEKNVSDISKLDYLYSRNDEIFYTLNIKMLSHRLDVIDISFIEQFGIYSDIQERILDLDDNILRIFGKMLSVLDKKEYDVTSIVFYVLKNIHKYKELLASIDYEKINSEELKNLMTIISKEENIYNICDVSELTDEKFEEKANLIYKKYDDRINDNSISMLEMKKILLEKKYGLSLSKAKFINKRYCHDIDSLKSSELPISTINLLTGIHDIVNSKSIEQLKFLYLTSKKLKTDFYSTIALESSIRREYSKLYSDSLYSPKEEHRLNSDNVLFKQNKNIYEKITNSTYNGKTPEFYVVDGDFNIQISALGAYSGWERPENFKEDWLRPKIANHAICTSYLGNNSLANARISHAVYGFSNYEASSFMYAGNYDLSSLNKSDNYAASIMEPYAFYNPKDMINYTRHNHNEICLERRLNKAENTFKRMPSYLIYFVDDINNERNFDEDNTLYQETLQAAIDFNIPIVIVDRLKYAKSEKSKCNELENTFMINLDPNILEELFLRWMTNCVGCRRYSEEEISEYQEIFSDSTFKDLYNRLFVNITSREMSEEKRYELINVLYKLVLKETTITSSPYISYFSGKCHELEGLIRKMDKETINPSITQDSSIYQSQIMSYFNQISDEEKEKIQEDIDNNISLEKIVNKINNNEYEGAKKI